MSGIDNAKAAMGWLHPNVRAACGNCAHAKVENHSPGFCKPNWRCTKGSFITPRFAVCDQHTPLRLTGGDR